MREKLVNWLNFVKIWSTQVQWFQTNSASSQPRWSDHHIESATPGHQYRIGFNNKHAQVCIMAH